MTAVHAAGSGRIGERAVEGLYVTGHWLLRLGRHREAAAVVRAMVRLSPRDERGWLALGACHEGVEQLDLALEMYGVGCVVAAPAPRCELARARALRALGMRAECLEAYERAARAAERAGEDDVAELIEHERRT